MSLYLSRWRWARFTFGESPNTPLGNLSNLSLFTQKKGLFLSRCEVRSAIFWGISCKFLLISVIYFLSTRKVSLYLSRWRWARFTFRESPKTPLGNLSNLSFCLQEKDRCSLSFVRFARLSFKESPAHFCGSSVIYHYVHKKKVCSFSLWGSLGYLLRNLLQTFGNFSNLLFVH